jgi:hypothetical protein
VEKTNEAMSMWDEMNLLYDNSKPFLTYLKKQGLNSALQQTDLTLKERHTIVPHVGSLTVVRVILESLMILLAPWSPIGSAFGCTSNICE